MGPDANNKSNYSSADVELSTVYREKQSARLGDNGYVGGYIKQQV